MPERHSRAAWVERRCRTWEPMARRSPKPSTPCWCSISKDGQIRELCAEACGFQYRTSIFNTSERGRFIILRVTYALTPGGKPRIEYRRPEKTFRGLSADSLFDRHPGSGAADTRRQGHADHSRGRGLPQRRFVLQESRTRRRPIRRVDQAGGCARDCRSPAIPRSMPRRKFPPPGWWSTPASARAIAAAGSAFRANMPWPS